MDKRKKNMKAKKEISTFKRLLTIFLIIIFPIIITGFCAIGFYGKRSEQEALNLVHVQMKYYIEKYEENMQEVQRRTIALLNNKDCSSWQTCRKFIQNMKSQGRYYGFSMSWTILKTSRNISKMSV